MHVIIGQVVGAFGLDDVAIIGAFNLARALEPGHQSARLLHRNTLIALGCHDQDRGPFSGRIAGRRDPFGVFRSSLKAAVELAQIGCVPLVHQRHIIDPGARDRALPQRRIALRTAGRGIAAVGPAHDAGALWIDDPLGGIGVEHVGQVVLHPLAIPAGGAAHLLEGFAIAARSAIIGLDYDIARFGDRLVPRLGGVGGTFDPERPAVRHDHHRQRLAGAVAWVSYDNLQFDPVAGGNPLRLDGVELRILERRAGIVEQLDRARFGIVEVVRPSL